MQFGFKKKSSTVVCTAVLDEIVNYYTKKGSNVYAVFLDASKAFDRVNHLKLFNLLQAKGVCPAFLRLLFNMYTNQVMSVVWNNCKSASFGASNGVKQGGCYFTNIIYLIYRCFTMQPTEIRLNCYITIYM